MNKNQVDEQISMLAHALRSVSETVVVTDMQDKILFVNDAFLRTYRYTEDELLGHDIGIVRSPNNPESVISQILPATLAGGWSGEVLNRRRGGEDFPVSLSSTVVRNENHQPIALIGVAVDITQRKRNERELVEAREAAEAAAKAKSEFLATMSHEIRTPMNGVIGMTELLMHTGLTPKQLDYVQTIQVCGENLLTIINDILDFSKIDSGRIEMESRPFELRKALEEVIGLLTPKVGSKDLKLVQRVEERVPTFVLGDVMRFKQILMNLVGNGIKFTEKGTVFVAVDLAGQSGDALELRCSIKDTGIGIPRDKRDRLFKAFSQVDTSTNRRFGGTGLGLAISAGLVQAMGGHIQVDSEAGVGSTFSFNIKTKAAAGAVSETPRQVTSKMDRDLAKRIPLKILVAEDNPVNQKLILHILSQMGYKADLVADGALAIAALQRSLYDLVFMDLHMPEVDGLQATRRIRSTIATNHHLRIIALTADALTGDREKCLAAGMDDYIRKPIRAEEVQAAIELWGARIRKQ